MDRLEKVPGDQNWLDHLPASLKARWHSSIIYRAAVHMHEERGMDVGHAIASAINWAKHIASTGDVKQWPGPQKVKPKSVAECAAALATWEAMKAAAKARNSKTLKASFPTDGYDVGKLALARVLNAASTL